MLPSKPQVVVITGASAGVGRAIAKEFATQRIRIGLLARGEAGLAAAADEVRDAGSKVLTATVDMANANEVDAAAKRIQAELGRIDCWINNATVSATAPFADLSADEFQRVTDVAYHGYVNGTRAALQQMRPAQRGTIVQVASAASYRGIPLQTAYSGTQAAIRGFTEALRAELTHDKSGVNLTLVYLPSLNTPHADWELERGGEGYQPIPPVYDVQVAASAVVFAAQHAHRREFWVGGSTMATILGSRFLPKAMMDFPASKLVEVQHNGANHRSGERQDNLWHPLDAEADAGTRTQLDKTVRTQSPQMWLSRHREAVMAGVVALAGAAAVAGKKLRSRS